MLAPLHLLHLSILIEQADFGLEAVLGEVFCIEVGPARAWLVDRHARCVVVGVAEELLDVDLVVGTLIVRTDSRQHPGNLFSSVLQRVLIA